MSNSTVEIWVDGSLWRSASLPSGVATGNNVLLNETVPVDTSSTPAGTPVNVSYTVTSNNPGDFSVTYNLPDGGQVSVSQNESFTSGTLQFYPGEVAKIEGTSLSGRTDNFTSTILVSSSSVAQITAASDAVTEYTMP